MDEKRPIVGITMGDPTGIGPEIVAKALSTKEVNELCKPLVVGDRGVMEQALEIARINNLKVNSIREVEQAIFEYGTMNVFDLSNVDLTKLVHGKVSRMGGRAAFEAIQKVIELAMEGKVDATVTGPIHKEALNLAGYHYSGHTEIYAELTGTKNYAMMLIHGDFRVVHVTTHISLRKACDLIKKDRVLNTIRLAHKAMLSLGIKEPRIGVAALNPHAGEGGLFGDEEKEAIRPAVEEAKNEGISVEGPVPPDTVFAKARGGRYDVVVAMYHDQGHIPLKLSGFLWDKRKGEWSSIRGVNVTLGLPIIRTSVDHGVAFDKAGKGKANTESLIEAIKVAVQMVKNKKCRSGI